jgi:hypothetical protein
MGPMKTLFRPVVATIIALVLLLALAGLAACGGAVGNVDPRTVLTQASANMKKVQGFHFVYEVHKPASANPAPDWRSGALPAT